MFFQDMFAMFIYPGNGNNAKTTVHSYVQRTPSRYASSQLSPATIPSSPFRQPSPHHHTLLYKAECFFFSFRILVLRRLRCRVPVTARSCWCRRLLDRPGGHREACAICKEGGARVTTNTRLADLNTQCLSRVDERRVEGVANGLPPEE